MSKNWQAVAEAINTRLDELNWTQKELAQRSKVSTATLRLLQKAAPASRTGTTLAAVSSALGWSPDYLEDLAGGEAVPGAGGENLRETVARLDAELSDLRARMDVLERRGE